MLYVKFKKHKFTWQKKVVDDRLQLWEGLHGGLQTFYSEFERNGPW